jgi:hypothetical protein
MEMSKVKYDYYECERCKINTETEGRNCPCPRGSCDAEKKGFVTITKNITFDAEMVRDNNNNLDDVGTIMAKMNL